MDAAHVAARLRSAAGNRSRRGVTLPLHYAVLLRTLTGPGSVGKTRHSLAIAHDLHEAKYIGGT